MVDGAPTGILEGVPTYKREKKLWREMRPTQRALMILNDADTCLLAVQMQHDRIATYPPSQTWPEVAGLVRQRNDVDFFFNALHRLVIVAELTEELSDLRGVMPGALKVFNDRPCGIKLSESDKPSTVASVRNALEHFQNLQIRGGLGFGKGGDRWYVSYRDRMFDTQELLDAALDLHRAIYAQP
jgi:hypothetical protein